MEVTVFEYRHRQDFTAAYLDTVTGLENLRVPAQTLNPFYLPPGGLPWFSDQPTLEFRGAGFIEYRETWIATVDPAEGGAGSAGQVFGGLWQSVGGPGCALSTDYTTASAGQPYLPAPRRWKVTYTLSSPAGSWTKVGDWGYGDNVIRTVPGLIQIIGGGSSIGVNPSPNIVYYSYSETDVVEYSYWGQSNDAFVIEDEQESPLTPGRKASYRSEPGKITTVLEQGPPTDNPGDGVSAFISKQWWSPWQYSIKFHLKDLEGNEVSKPVLFLQSVFGGGNPAVVEEKTGSFEATVSESFQWIEYYGRLTAAGINRTKYGNPPVSNLKYPLGGVMIDARGLNGASATGGTPIQRWKGAGNAWLSVYAANGGETPTKVPLLPLVRPDSRAKNVPVPLSPPRNANAEFTLRNIKLKQRLPWPRQPGAPGRVWQINYAAPGYSISGNTLVNGPQPAVFFSRLSGSSFGAVHPYRYLSVTCTAEKAGVIEIWLDQPVGILVFRKGYKVSVKEGTNKVWIDTANPERIFYGAPTPYPTWTPAKEFARLDRQNVEAAHPSFYSSGRFGGIWSVSGVYVVFADNTITLSDWGGEVRYQAKARQSSPRYAYDPFALTGDTYNPYFLGTGNAQYQIYGEVDGLDAFRSTFPIGLTSWPDTASPFVTTGVDNLTPVLINQPAIRRDGTLYPEVDIVTDGLDLEYSYFIGQGIFAGFFGCNRAGVWGDGPEFHASMVWGNGLAVSTPKPATAKIKRETFDGSFSQDLTIDCKNNNGYGFQVIDWHFPPAYSPLEWGNKSPSEGAALNRDALHFRYSDPSQAGSIQYAKLNESLSFGAVFWLGSVPLIEPGKGGIALRSSHPGYMVSWADAAGNWLIETRWRADSSALRERVIEEGPGWRGQRLEFNSDEGYFSAIAIKDGELYRRISHDFGDEWIPLPSSGDPLYTNVLHARERHNGRTHEDLFFVMSEDQKVRVEIFSGKQVSQGTFPVDEDGIGGIEFDDASFDVEIVEDATHFIDMIGMVDGERRRFRSTDDGREWFEEPL